MKARKGKLEPPWTGKLSHLRFPNEGREHEVLGYVVQKHYMCSLASAFLHVAQREGVYLLGTLLLWWYRKVLLFKDVRLPSLIKKNCFKGKHLSSSLWLGESLSQRDNSITVSSCQLLFSFFVIICNKVPPAFLVPVYKLMVDAII